MAGYNRRKQAKEDKIFFTDNLTEADKKRISTEFSKETTNSSDCIQKLLDNQLSVKIHWSDYTDSYSAIVSPIDRDHPSTGTFYSAFHSEWKKALFIVAFLLQDRYDFGDWTRGREKVNDNSW
jgi:hypothetical protein